MAAYSRRTLTLTLTSISRRFHPSFSHLLPNSSSDERAQSQTQTQYQARPHFQNPNRNLRFHFPLALDPFLRSYSSSPSSSATIEGSSNEIGFISDVADGLTDPSIEVAASAASVIPLPFPGEVAAAAADSFPPVAALQHVIDAVHSFTGLNWWASIALTTVLIRGVTIPLLLNQMKATVKLSAMRPEMEELKDRMQNSMGDQQIMMESQKQMKALFKKHGVTPFTPLKGLLIQGPVFISFFMAISNMVEKVPSFKGGGAYWFTDLTTPDPFYALPILTGLSFLVTVELNMQEGMEGNPMAKTMKLFSRGMAVMTVPFTASFPKAIFCYWITSNLFSLIYGFVIKHKPVRKFLNLPDIVPQSNPPASPNFSFFGGAKVEPPPSPVAVPANEQVKRISSSTVMSHRIRNLEKQVKGRNRPKKR